MSSQEDNPTTESAKTIKAINKDTVHKICSGQVKQKNFLFQKKKKHIKNRLKQIIKIQYWFKGCTEFGDCCKGIGRKCIGCWSNNS